jgi:hypothetical protein
MADRELDLAEVAREAGEEFGLDRVDCRYDVRDGPTLIGDHDALRRAAGNLLSNAVRPAPEGSTVTIATGRAGGWLWPAVVDQGPGIPPEDLPRVFDRFWRGPSPVSPAPVPAAPVSPAVAPPLDARGGQHVRAVASGRTGDLPPPAASPWPRTGS